jgi:hypothetical protein
MAHLFPVIILAAVVVSACQDHNPAATTSGPSSVAVPGETIFAEDFESGTLAAWQDGVDPARHRVITDAAAAQSGSRYLAVTYPSGRDGGWLTRFFMPGYDAVNVSYYVRFPAAWVGSTKLIALYGSQVDNQWSAFGKAGLCPSGGDFFAAMMVAEAGADPGPARFYTYYPAMRREPDGVTCWGRFGDGSETYAPVSLSRGVWHRVEFSVTLNTPGQANARHEFSIDGVQRGSWSGFSFRDTDILRLNSVQLTFSANLESQPRELHVDNVSVRAVSSR